MSEIIQNLFTDKEVTVAAGDGNKPIGSSEQGGIVGVRLLTNSRSLVNGELWVDCSWHGPSVCSANDCLPGLLCGGAAVFWYLPHYSIVDPVCLAVLRFLFDKFGIANVRWPDMFMPRYIVANTADEVVAISDSTRKVISISWINSAQQNIFDETSLFRAIKECVLEVHPPGPQPHHFGCGFHAYKPSQWLHISSSCLHSTGPTGIFPVLMKGRMIEHEDGYRAQYMRLLSTTPLSGLLSIEEAMDLLRQYAEPIGATIE